MSRAANIEEIRVGFDGGSRPGDNGQVTLASVRLHPSFVGSVRSYDLALARLSSPLSFDDQVRPVCLPPSSGSRVFSNRSQCVVTGLAYTPMSGRPYLDFDLDDLAAEAGRHASSFPSLFFPTLPYRFPTVPLPPVSIPLFPPLFPSFCLPPSFPSAALAYKPSPDTLRALEALVL